MAKSTEIIKAQIKTREELIKLGYVDSKDPAEFVNLLASKELTIVEVSENGKVFVCEEYPEYAIYDIAVTNYKLITDGINKDSSATEYNFEEIGRRIGKSGQTARNAYHGAIKKIQQLIQNSKECKYLEKAYYELDEIRDYDIVVQK